MEKNVVKIEKMGRWLKVKNKIVSNKSKYFEDSDDGILTYFNKDNTIIPINKVLSIYSLWSGIDGFNTLFIDSNSGANWNIDGTVIINNTFYLVYVSYEGDKVQLFKIVE